MDVLVMMDEPAHVGCLLDVRLIGAIEAMQREGGKHYANDRLIAVAVRSYNHENVSRLDQVSASIVKQVEEFFISYNKSRGKKFELKGRHGPRRAGQTVEQGSRAFDKKKKK